MELKVKNLASSDPRGYDLQKEVMVKVTHQRTHEVRTLAGMGFLRRSPRDRGQFDPYGLWRPSEGAYVF